MTQLFANNAVSTLAAGITSGATSLSVQAGDGALFPNPTAPDFFLVTLEAGATREVVKVTARSTDTFTIVRAQEGTTASAFSTGDKVELRATKGTLELLQAFVFQKSNLTEATTTSTTAVDLISVTGLNIASSVWMLILVNFRKGSGTGGQTVSLGLKLNATEVLAPVVVSASTTGTLQGLALFLVPPVTTNYERSGVMLALGASPSASNVVGRDLSAADRPNATITDVVIRGLTGATSHTLGVQQVLVYTLRKD